MGRPLGSRDKGKRVRRYRFKPKEEPKPVVAEVQDKAVALDAAKTETSAPQTTEGATA